MIPYPRMAIYECEVELEGPVTSGTNDQRRRNLIFRSLLWFWTKEEVSSSPRPQQLVFEVQSKWCRHADGNSEKKSHYPIVWIWKGSWKRSNQNIRQNFCTIWANSKTNSQLRTEIVPKFGCKDSCYAKCWLCLFEKFNYRPLNLATWCLQS